MPLDPLSIVTRLDSKFSVSMASFEQTSAEWRKVAENINGLVDTNRGNLNEVVERAATALHEFTITMQEAKQTLQATNKVFADPQTQESLRQTLAALQHRNFRLIWIGLLLSMIGSFMQNTALPNGINGGMTVYYTQQDFNSNGNQKITSFKPVSSPPMVLLYCRQN